MRRFFLGNIKEIRKRFFLINEFWFILGKLLWTQFVCISGFIFDQNIVIFLDVRIKSIFYSILWPS